MRTLVTGATGLVGHAIARRLLAAGHEVRALLRPRSDRSRLPDGTAPVAGDVTEPASLPAAVDGCDVVFHAAGLPEQWRRDVRDFDRVNHLGTANVLAAAAEAGVARVVHTSTLDVFAPDDDGVLRETRPDPEPKPTAYERSKVAAERAVDRAVADGLDVVVVNPAAVYGPGPTTTGTTQLFLRLARGQAPMLPPGGMSVVYVEGLADAQLAAAERGRTGERYLVSDAYVTMRELAGAIVAAAGRRRVPPTAPAWLLRAAAVVSEPVARLVGGRPLITAGELHFLLWQARVDPTKARRELGVEPTALDDGVRRTIEDLRRRRLLP